MSLRATKNLTRTPPGHLHCIKQGIGVEKRLSATYMPLQFILGEPTSALGLDETLDMVLPSVDCLDGGCMGGRSSLPLLNPLPSCPVAFVPLGHLACSQKNFGEDKCVPMVYSPGKVLGIRDYLCLGPKDVDCSDLGYQVSNCLEKCGHFSLTSQSTGNSILNGDVPPSLRLGLQSDFLGLMTCDLGISDLQNGLGF